MNTDILKIVDRGGNITTVKICSQLSANLQGFLKERAIKWNPTPAYDDDVQHGMTFHKKQFQTITLEYPAKGVHELLTDFLALLQTPRNDDAAAPKTARIPRRRAETTCRQ